MLNKQFKNNCVNLPRHRVYFIFQVNILSDNVFSEKPIKYAKVGNSFCHFPYRLTLCLSPNYPVDQITKREYLVNTHC